MGSEDWIESLIVGYHPFLGVREVRVVQELSSPLGPSHAVHLLVSPEEGWLHAEVVSEDGEKTHVERQAEAPVNLHCFYLLLLINS